MAERGSLMALPAVLCGPLLRRVQPDRMVLCLVTSRPLDLTLVLTPQGQPARTLPLASAQQVVPLGRQAHLVLLDVALDEPLPTQVPIAYDVVADGVGGVAHWAPHLLAPGQSALTFVVAARLDRILYGSCRKPHSAVPDGLARVADVLAADAGRPEQAPALLMLCGDQVYVDDVAGPMLATIHALIGQLGLFDETLEGAVVADSQALYAHPQGFYHREDLLPAVRANRDLRERFFGGAEKPVFTSASAHNHLVTLAEMVAMYLLVWSPVPWQLVEGRVREPALAPEAAARYAREAANLARFRHDLPRAAQALAQVPTLMIFDDHDVTDDWNLSARWEMTAYGHPFSRRIIGNAVVAYALLQGWGNRPEAFGEVVPALTAWLTRATSTGWLDGAEHDVQIGRLLRFRQWHFHLPTTPALVVLDTRTQRWRSEWQPSQPSGLMDWESLCDLQQVLLDQPAAVIVSPAPMFGVKLIEVLQRVMTWLGFALMVDAENWMAHRGAARTMMNIFRHSRTPANYVVLSGDVHYSFVYDIEIRQRDRAPRLWQLTSSGLKNEFPRRLLDWLDRLNRWLYAPWSPLNWLTKRRQLRLLPRLPSRRSAGERLWNRAGVGDVRLDDQGRPRLVLHHNADGSPTTVFEPGEEAAAELGLGTAPPEDVTPARWGG